MEGRTVEQAREEELLARARSGDRAAFAALVREHGDMVYTLARRLVGDPHLAADISQEALIRAWKALPGFRGDSQFSTWLHRITVNTAWTQKKKAKRHAGSSLDEVGELAAPFDSEHPEIAGEIAELRTDLRRALNALPEGQRQIVVLKDIYGWSHAEISESLGITVTAAKVRLHRARSRLARMLEDV
ncbi:MAG: RNA polymerase subunit sigma-24 [Actinobacteria bacterium]|nr:MAG: RNA polymerase subunit sigma-24 [Actinomycetota bacterium]REK40750.1 MAG: RNA polymerase subunit sigma-24 [Actinomycetota bacterium]